MERNRPHCNGKSTSSVSDLSAYVPYLTQLGDSFGILLASIVSIPFQVLLCDAQVARGRDLCTRV